MSVPNLSSNLLFDIKGKQCVVTGGGGGIGLMIAAAYIQNGADVIIASRKEKVLQTVTEQLNKLGKGKCQYIVADLSSKAGCDAMVAEIKKRVSKIHVLVNNSGVTWGAPLTDFDEKGGWDRVIGTNVKGPFYVTAGLVDLLAKDSNNIDPARVINISSVAGIDNSAEGPLSAPGHGVWSYNASKAALDSLTRTLSVSLAEKNIIVNAICPGVFPSRMTAYGIKEHGEEMTNAAPLGRVGTTEDMAGLAIFLASRASSHLNGVLFYIDGGQRLRGKPKTSKAKL